jgi:hypothetical protein
MIEISRRSLVLSGAVAALAAFKTPAEAAAGTIYLKIVSAGFIFGVTGGDGVLTFGGRRYPLSIGGLSAGLTAGLAGTELVGTVRHLRTAADIQGVYSKFGVNASLPSGSSYQDLANPNGVSMRLQGRQTGFMISVDLSGMTLALK